MTHQPPTLARQWLRRSLPRDVRAVIVADLDEVFQRRVDADGIFAARRWYWREALSFTWRFLRERVTGRPSTMRLSMLDVKLAARMVTAYPGLTLIGGLAIATAIGVTVIGFEITHDLSNPSLPLPQSDRVVSVQMWDGRWGSPESRLMFDLTRWRDAQSFDSIGGYQTIERTLVANHGEGELVRAAEMSASGFRVAAVAPLLGRTLVDADEAIGASPVAVVGYRLWTSRFNSDPNIVGRTLHLGSVGRTIVGVMPEGFGFPVSHSLWIPLMRQDALERLTGPVLRVFGRLTSSSTASAAQSELAAISARQPWPARVAPTPLTPRVVPYASAIVPLGYIRRAYLLQSVLVLLLVICCSNVAALVFARTATRQNEIIVRTALGAARSRILGQFFVEALALAGIGAAVGLGVANAAVQWTMKWIWSSGSPRPFWWDDRIAPVTYLYAGALTLVVALLCGIVPALKGTRAGVHAGLQQGSGRAASLTFGFGWTAIVVLQIALCVALLPAALALGWDAMRAQASGAGFATNEYLAVALDVEPGSEPRRTALYRDLELRVRREPDVRGVAFASAFPGMSHTRGAIEVDGDPMADRIRPRSFTANVAPGFFSALDVQPIAGRTFVDADALAGRQVAVVNRLFVDQVFGGRNAIGRRVRFASNGAPNPWMEIIGVVPDLGMSALRPEEGMGLYSAAAPGERFVEGMAIHVAGDAAAFAPRLRAMALEVSPVLQLKNPMPLNVVGRADQIGVRLFALALAAVAVIGVILSAAAIYSLMSFTVSRRTREIAIRAALGANPRRIVAEIFSRVALQIGLGAIAGVAMVLIARPQSAREVWLPAGLAVFMFVIGLCACAVPARRALRIEPSDALKDVT